MNNCILVQDDACVAVALVTCGGCLIACAGGLIASSPTVAGLTVVVAGCATCLAGCVGINYIDCFCMSCGTDPNFEIDIEAKTFKRLYGCTVMVN